MFALVAPAGASGAVFNVNTTADTVTAGACAAGTIGACSLREAVIESNAISTGNTINLPPGTYTLTRSDGTITGENSTFNSQNNELDLQSNVTINGTAGAASTIVQAGTSPTNGISLIFIINGYPCPGGNCNFAAGHPLNVTLSGMTMRFGRNHYDAATWGQGGAIEQDASDGGTLTLSNDVITQNSAPVGEGGGIALFNDARNNSNFNAVTSSTTLNTITNTVISNNTGSAGGGGIFVGTNDPIVMTSSTVSGNTMPTSGGGGMLAFGPGLEETVAGGTPSSITNSTFSGNAAGGGQGGGLFTTQAMTISGSTFSNNSTGTNGQGGGIYEAADPGRATSITGATLTGNSVTGPVAAGFGGGGIYASSGTLNVTGSRITGNSATSGGSGIYQDPNNVIGIVNATDDWWGCNGGPGATGCDTAAGVNTTAGSSFTTTPRLQLRTSASPGSVNVGGSSTLTASLLKDSAGNALSAGNVSALFGVPVSWTAVHGGISNQQATIQSSGTATATLTNDGSCNNSTGRASVDNSGADLLTIATVTVQCPNLSVTKSDNVSHATGAGGSWTWNLHVSNGGAGTASFANGSTILSDNLPGSGLGYGVPIVSTGTGLTGTVNCQIVASDLSCTAGGLVVLNSSGSFDVSFTATASATGTFTNPRSGGSCSVDPNGGTGEAPGANTACNSDSVTVTAPDLTATKTDDVSGTSSLGSHWTWKIHVANGGNGAATFGDGERILLDNLPSSGLVYGAASVAAETGLSGAGTVACSISGSDLTCTANGGPVIVGVGGSFDVSFTATPSNVGTFSNPRSGGVCTADPGGVITESVANQSCSDTVTVAAPNLSVTKSDNVGNATTLGNSWTWTLHLANSGTGVATFASGSTILSDALPSTAISYGAPSVANASGVGGTGTIACQIASNVLSCTASGGTVTIGASTGVLDVNLRATPSTTGTFSNPNGSCSVDPSSTITETPGANTSCNTDAVVVTAPDLTATKTDDAGGHTVFGGHWTWKIHVANGGGSAAATFASGQSILLDNLPDSGIGYGVPAVAGETGITGSGAIACQVVSSDLSCTASGGSVTIAAGTGAFDMTLTATSTTAGVFVNPRAGGSCGVDPGGVVTESQANQSCSDTVTVTTPDLTVVKSDDVGGATTLGNSWNWKLHIANGGSAPASIADTNVILADTLPNSGITYGAVSVANPSGLTGTVNCSVSAGQDLTCTASGAVSLAAGGSFDVLVHATPMATGTFTNPRQGGACAVDPNGVVAESGGASETCNSDAVTVTAPLLTASKIDDVGGQAALGGHWTWTIHVANGGNTAASFPSADRILLDNLPSSGLAYGAASVAAETGLSGAGTVACSISGSDLTCTANGGPVIIGAGGSFDVSFTATPSTAGSFRNPRAGGSCSVDPDNVISAAHAGQSCSDTVTVVAPDLRATKSDDVGGATILGHGWTWKIHLANTGTAAAILPSGSTILTDDLPSAGIAYGAPSVASPSGVNGTGTIACQVVSNVLTCAANGGSVALAAGTGAFDVMLGATPSTPGVFANPRPGGTCTADPNGALSESPANRSCSDTVTVAGAPSAQIVKPADHQVFKPGDHVATSFSCSEAAGGPGIKSCLDSKGASSPGQLNTSKPGSFAYTVTATSKDGLIAVATIHYSVLAPRGRFKVEHVHVRHDGVVRFDVTVPAAGVVNVLETAWRFDEEPLAATAAAPVLLRPAPFRFVFSRAHLQARHAGTIHLTVKPDQRGSRLVKHHRHLLRIRLWVTFTPPNGPQLKIGFYGLFVAK